MKNNNDQLAQILIAMWLIFQVRNTSIVHGRSLCQSADEACTGGRGYTDDYPVTGAGFDL